ncbi:hypothetical protein J2W15_001025 [Pseudarthrobacter sulfonivorans]|nr:hypothetical protein [Pseudarthrobacter sulfonivorans]
MTKTLSDGRGAAEQNVPHSNTMVGLLLETA